MKNIVICLALLLSAAHTYAQPKQADLMGLGMSAELASKMGEEATAFRSNAAPIKIMNASGTPISVLQVDSSNKTLLNGSTTVEVQAAGTPEVDFTDDKLTSIGNTFVHVSPTRISFAAGSAGTPVANVQSDGVAFPGTGQVVYPAAAVITPSTSYPTPAAGNTLSGRRTILAAGAPTAAFVVLPAATSSIGKAYTIYNQGSNPLAISPQLDTVNVQTAATPYSCASAKECECVGLNSTTWGCTSR